MGIIKKSIITIAALVLSSVVAADAYARCVSICGYSSSPWGGIDKVYICDENGQVCRIVYAEK